MRKTMKRNAGTWVLFATHAPMEDESWFGLAHVEPEKIDAAFAGIQRLRDEGIEITSADLGWSVWWFTTEDLAGVRLPVKLDDLESFAILSERLGKRLAEKYGQSTECDTAVLALGGIDPHVFWECYPKNGDHKIETQFLSWATLRAALVPADASPSLEAVG